MFLKNFEKSNIKPLIKKLCPIFSLEQIVILTNNY